MVKASIRFFMVVLSSSGILFGCQGGAAGDSRSSAVPSGNGAVPSGAVPSEISVSEYRPPVAQRSFKTDVLIYSGDAAAYDGPEAIAEILSIHGKTYEMVSSSEFDKMTVDDIAEYGVIAWPGGYAGQQSGSLLRQTRDNIRRAVAERGVGFVGFCAGAFIAISPTTSWGFALVEQETLPYYYLEDVGVDSRMVEVKMADGKTRDLVWWGGPYLPEFPGGVIARYAETGQPAIAQTWSGNGLVVLAGPHPEAPEVWRSRLGLEDEDSLDWEIAWQMFDAALKRQPMPSY